MVFMPPMPVPMMTAVRGPAKSSRPRPACAIASSAAITAYCVNGSQNGSRLGFDVSGRLEERNLGGELDAPVIGNFGAQFAHLRSAVPRRAPKLSRAHPRG